MAMDVGGAKGGVKSDINVTPLVDVMLVLLIIMMLIAPLLNKQVNVTMPEASNTTDKPDTSDQTVVFVDAQSKLYIGSTEFRESDLIDQLKKSLEDKSEKIVYLKGDRDAPYGAIMKMMDALRGAQIDSVGLITEKKGANAQQKGGQ